MVNTISVSEAMRKAPRSYFLPQDQRVYGHFDEALPIGYGQTCSQPSTVREMLEWLCVEPGDHVLDVGSGSGWTSAILSKLVGSNGKVDAVEIVPELVEFGKNNCKRLDLNNIEFHKAEKAIGWAKNAPYDRILVSASAKELIEPLVEQLKDGGTMIIPINDSIFVIEKNGEDLDITEHYGYAFVPLITK